MPTSSPSHTTLPALTALIMGLTACHGCPRSEDALEPNDTRETATRLQVGIPVEGRAVEHNPDVFVVTVPAGSTSLMFDLDSRSDDEPCATFRVIHPSGRALWEEDEGSCPHGRPQRVGEVTLTIPREGSYRITVPIDAPGDYSLRIDEQGQADNLFSFSWDYRLTALIR